ncbi:hypothetical protein [Nocardia harenae]|uniref:hypothetical protein n=1 Tax=Nocardia harenae TaxID=358707 RepID=UPI00083783DC|nr:hypothetical protein [Nocardia harenae]
MAVVHQHASPPRRDREDAAETAIQAAARVCRAAGFSIEQRIITARPGGPHREPARPETAAVATGNSAGRSGLGALSYSGRRFRAHYGPPPRTRRDLARLEAAERAAPA